jgi:hypothetical protein
MQLFSVMDAGQGKSYMNPNLLVLSEPSSILSNLKQQFTCKCFTQHLLNIRSIWVFQEIK